MLFSTKIENRCFIVAIVFTVITLLIQFSAGKGASFGGIAFVGGIYYFVVRSIVYLWFLITGKLKRTDKEAKGHAGGLFFILIIGTMIVPLGVWKFLLTIIPVQNDNIWSIGLAMTCVCVYLFGGLKLIHCLSPDE